MIAKPIPNEQFGSTELKSIIEKMSDVLAEQDDGVALAAPQIGISLRIFVVSGKVFEMLYPDEAENKKYADLAFINPEIIKKSRTKKMVDEGCLSVRYLYGQIERSTKAKVRAQDVNGKWFEIGGAGLLAQIFQHETDHLDGKLFIDRAVDVEDIPPEKRKTE
jgi:peptide deformylase